MADLKPCPFCGKKARLSYGQDYYSHELYVFAMCCSCGMRTPKIFYITEPGELSAAETMAVQKWNRRVNNG